MSNLTEKKISRRKWLYLAGGVVTAAVVGGGGYVAWQALQPPTTQGPIKIGAVLSLSGTFAQIGGYYKQGYSLWTDDVNAAGGLIGRPVEVVFADDTSDATTCATLLEHFISVDKVDAILGPYGSNIVFATMVINEKYQMPMVEAGGAVESAFSRGFKYSFMTICSQTIKAKTYIDFVKSLQPTPKTIAVLAENSALWKPFAADLGTFGNAAGLQVADTELYTVGTTDFAPLLLKLKAANPDVFIGADYAPESVEIQNQSVQNGFKPKLFIHTTGAALASFLQSVGAQNANGVAGGSEWEPIMTESFAPGTQKLRTEYKAKYGADPQLYVAMAYGAAQVLEAAIRKVGSLDKNKVRDAIANTNMNTVNGPVRFDSRGINIAKPYPIIQWQGGVKQLVFPASASTANVVYPVP